MAERITFADWLNGNRDLMFGWRVLGAAEKVEMGDQYFFDGEWKELVPLYRGYPCHAMQCIVRRRVSTESRKIWDDPMTDGTDFAHPAWWRGHDHAVAVFCQKVTDILDGKDCGAGVANAPWESVRRKLLVLRQLLLAVDRYLLASDTQGLHFNGQQIQKAYHSYKDLCKQDVTDDPTTV